MYTEGTASRPPTAKGLADIETQDNKICTRVAALVFWVKTWNHGVRKDGMVSKETIDWSECPLVEVKPGVQSGAAVLRGTRMPANAIFDNFDYGVSATEIAEQFEILPERGEAILPYAKSHRVAHLV